MTRFNSLCPMVFLVTCLSACSQSQVATNYPTGDCSPFSTAGAEADRIRTLENAGAEINVKGQSLADAEQFFAPEFVSIGPNGALIARVDLLKNYKNGHISPWASQFTLKELEVRVYRDAAIATGVTEAVPLGLQTKIQPIHFRYLNVWTRHGTTWWLSATQYTKF